MSTYWEESGKYQELSDKLETLVPFEGAASTPELELYRLVSNIYYDLYNNALINVEYHLSALKPIISKFKQQLLAEGMTEEQVNLVWNCWVPIEADYPIWARNDVDNDASGFFPEWDDSTEWFSERLELAFEALADASVVIAAKSEGLVVTNKQGKIIGTEQ